MEGKIDEKFAKSRARAEDSPENTFDYDRHRLALGEFANLPKWEKLAHSMTGAIVNQPVYIDEDDKIIGRVYYKNAKPVAEPSPDLDYKTTPKSEADLLYPGYSELVRYQLATWDNVGHIAWDWNAILRHALLALPKYGQENEEADALAARLAKDMSEIYSSYQNRFGGNGKLVILSFIWAPAAGAILAATPDGRLAGVPTAQGVTPQSMAMTKGITAAMNSCTKMPFELFCGGASTMWDLDSSWASESIIRALFTAFFEGGGHIFQGNTTDVETLIKAQREPELYPNLIVRVGGFSARFVNLKPELQKRYHKPNSP